eukprot:gene13381-biopygen21557
MGFPTIQILKQNPRTVRRQICCFSRKSGGGLGKTGDSKLRQIRIITPGPGHRLRISASGRPGRPVRSGRRPGLDLQNCPRVYLVDPGGGGAPPPRGPAGLADRAGPAGPTAPAGPVGLDDLARVTRLAHWAAT